MKESKELTQKEIRRLFSYNKKTGSLRWKNKTSSKSRVKIGDEVGCIAQNGYRKTKIYGKMHLVHRIIWFGVYGYLPENDIDHKDRIKHHNWLSNLREASKQCNSRNRKNINNKSGIHGVFFNKVNNNWKAQIGLNLRTMYLGTFNDFNEAVCIRLAAEQCLNWEGCDCSSDAYRYVKENIQN